MRSPKGVQSLTLNQSIPANFRAAMMFGFSCRLKDAAATRFAEEVVE
jgi:hypothetical protein